MLNEEDAGKKTREAIVLKMQEIRKNTYSEIESAIEKINSSDKTHINKVFITKFYDLNFNDNEANLEDINSENFIEAICKSLKGNKLKGNRLDLSNLNLNKAKAKEIAKSLSNSQGIKNLMLPSNPALSDEGLGYICEALRKSEIDRMLLYNNNLTEEAMMHLAQLIQNSQISQLIISHNQIFDEGMSNLVNCFNESTSLKSLILSGNQLSWKSLEIIGSYLSQEYCTLSNLVLSTSNLNFFRPQGFSFVPESKLADESSDKDTRTKDSKKSINYSDTIFLESISKNKSLENLEITNSNFQKESIYLIQAIAHNPIQNISNLDLSNNHLNDNSLKEILDHINKTKIRVLILNDNLISDLGMFFFQLYLKRSWNEERHLQQLYLNENKVSDDGAKCLIMSIESNYLFLNILGLAFNCIQEENIIKIANALVKINQVNNCRPFQEIYFNKDKYLNIGQTEVDLKRNLNMNDSRYREIYEDVIEAEKKRFYGLK